MALGDNSDRHVFDAHIHPSDLRSDLRPDGFTLWLTGLSGAGKTTLASNIATELRRRGLPVEMLDGDTVRENLSAGLGFSHKDRDTNVLRIGFVANLLRRHGVCVIVAAISPYRKARAAVRAAHEGSFVEVHVECPLATVIERDAKGLYKRALAGEISNFTGVSDPYEAPRDPEIVVHTGDESIADSTNNVLLWLARNGYLPGELEHSMDLPVIAANPRPWDKDSISSRIQ